MLPVPLNSSKISSSIRLPVSTKAVPIIVIDPPSSKLRAAPKKRLGGYKAAGSNPPDKVRPEVGIARLYARANLVIESKTITTSPPASAILLARSRATSATIVWSSAFSSKLEAATKWMGFVAFAVIVAKCLLISVTSSGLSPIKTAMMVTSGKFVATPVIISFRIVVFPAFGGDTIKPLWPLPIGAIKSITRVAKTSLVVSKVSRSSG